MNKLTRIVLKSGKDQSLRRFHPWVFSGAIKKIYGEPAEGDIVEVYDNKDEFLALGHYQIGSIAVRVFSFRNEVPGFDFWKAKIQSAWDYRRSIGLADSSVTNAFRLVYAEGDGLPGLIMDYYDGMVVMQMHSVGMYLIREQLVDALKSVLGDKLKGVYDKSSSTLPFKAGLDAQDELLLGSGNEAMVLENGCKFKVNWVEGQKTGFFIDQRENRELVGKFSRGRKVLNMFCYTGGFSIYALQGGAELVHSVDSSAKAIDLTNENVVLNFGPGASHQGYATDAFSFLDDMKEEYDVIILDPPAFAKHQNVLQNALQGYKRLNQKALEKIKSGGYLFTYSCSQVVNRENFRKSVFAASANARRDVRVVHQLSQPADHSFSIYHPEGEYLKGLLLQVE